MTDRLLILDAGGVFMNEMPYWCTALAAAFAHAELEFGSSAWWNAFAQVAFVDERLQRVTKARGCNSNWDLAALLADLLREDRVLAEVRDALTGDDFPRAVRAFRAAADARWCGAPETGPMVGGFGIDKHGAHFHEVVHHFQEIFFERRPLRWKFPKQELAADVATVHAIFGALRQAGWRLAVCTSRLRGEVVGPLADFGILDYFEPDRIITQDDVLAGQERTGQRPLSKPHWLPLAVVVCGFEAAVGALQSGAGLSPPPGRFTYVGDASADFLSAAGARRQGLVIDYLHVDSGVSEVGLLAEIAAEPHTLGLVPDLASAAGLLLGVAA